MKPFKLDNVPKIESGFKVPDNYFENFSATLLEKLPIEPIAKESKVLSLFKKRKKILLGAAAVLTLALIIPTVLKTETKKKELDSVTIENYLAEEGHINQYELFDDIEAENIIITDSKKIESQTIEDMLVSNPNIENLVIEN
jgi:hypothetical protein